MENNCKTIPVRLLRSMPVQIKHLRAKTFFYTKDNDSPYMIIGYSKRHLTMRVRRYVGFSSYVVEHLPTNLIVDEIIFDTDLFTI